MPRIGLKALIHEELLSYPLSGTLEAKKKYYKVFNMELYVSSLGDTSQKDGCATLRRRKN